MHRSTVLACLALAACSSDPCDSSPTGVESSDFFLDFTMPAGLMPDPQFDGQPARLRVRRVKPVYARGKCAGVPSLAAVLVHGRSVPAVGSFDLRSAALGGKLSVLETLARAGIDSFAPDLLGYGLSTKFAHGLDDPCNASLKACPMDEPLCDKSNNIGIFPLDQQGTALAVNPLAGQRCAHSSKLRFATTDVWVRDLRQVIDEAITRAGPDGGQVALIGYSLGAQRVGRLLHRDDGYRAKVSRVVYVAPVFFGTTDEVEPPTGFATFPLTTFNATLSSSLWAMLGGRASVCTGNVPTNAPEALLELLRADEKVGLAWGGTTPGDAPGLIRSPTYSGYGFNAEVAAALSLPALVMHGLDDPQLLLLRSDPCVLYDALATDKKILVQLDCASHGLLAEGCAEDRCHGWTPGEETQEALVEWIQKGTYHGAASGRFLVDASGVGAPGMRCPWITP